MNHSLAVCPFHQQHLQQQQQQQQQQQLRHNDVTSSHSTRHTVTTLPKRRPVLTRSATETCSGSRDQVKISLRIWLYRQTVITNSTGPYQCMLGIITVKV